MSIYLVLRAVDAAYLCILNAYLSGCLLAWIVYFYYMYCMALDVVVYCA